jgi:DinB superfamily
MESCEDCGFVWERVDRGEIAARVLVSADAVADVLATNPPNAAVRPSPTRWSSVEYGAHIRDVLLTVRDRLVIGLVEDNPGFKPLYKDERLEIGLYRGDTAPAIASELRAAAAMFARLFDAIDPALLSRRVQYGFPDPMERTLLWMGQQAVHETEHHRTDIDENQQQSR